MSQARRSASIALSDVPRLSKILFTDEREERFGKAKYASQWDSCRLSAEEMHDAGLIADYNDVPPLQREFGYWKPLSGPWYLMGSRNPDPFWVCCGQITNIGMALPRVLARKRQVEDIRERLALLDRYGAKFDPLENPPPSERPKLDKARALYRQVQEQNEPRVQTINDRPAGTTKSLSPVHALKVVPRTQKTVPAHVARRRGQRPDLRNRVKEAMLADLRAGKFTAADFKEMTEEAMKAQYEASRDTCRKARDEALPKFNSRQTATIDN